MKKADVAEHPEVSHHVGLLINAPIGAGPNCALSSPPDDTRSRLSHGGFQTIVHRIA
jgi:hypothetical protein